MTRMIFINLPVSDLARSTRFYEAIGCTRNEQFSNDEASSMVWSDQIFFHLLTRDYFATFTSKQIPDAQATCQVLLCISQDSREAVDGMVAAAVAAGGKADPREPMDLHFMYNRALEDPDGHVFELVWMNPDAAPAE